MSDIAIRVENLGKRYKIGRAQKRHDTLRDLIVSKLQRTNGHQPSDETFWALKDVSFEVKQGEVVGIIGRNGAGMSTLLKILARITEPTIVTEGLYGRVGSLLEVRTGFHPEFDEIESFAEMENFIDTPVKHYSRGMYQRLAFAVAAHLEPEILIVDELLAVGDRRFRKSVWARWEMWRGKGGR
jgi:lipopolysaccharide transport system ATP-binding protein